VTGGLRALVHEPFGERVRAAAPCGIQRAQVVVADPLEIRAARQQVLGCAALAAVAGAPRTRSQLGTGAALEQPPRRRPLAEGDRIVQRRPAADDRSRPSVGCVASNASSSSSEPCRID
jgi:hypothetical protein